MQLMLPLVTSKACSRCRQTKLLADYYASTHGRYGRAPECKACHKARSATWAKTNAGRRKQIALGWYHAHKQQARDYERANKPTVRARQAAWRDANREHLREYKRAWIAAHPEVASVQKAKRRAREADAVSTVTKRDVRETFEYFGRRCAYCLRADVKLTMDHVTALNSGGHDTPDNIVPACAACNGRKADRGVLYMLNRCASASRAL
jgi:5-methylcytosine-specific restriction endonuclease McrA